MNSDLLKEFQFERILNQDFSTKSICLLGYINHPDSGKNHAIIVVEKLHFPENEVPTLVQSRFERITWTQLNDIYAWGTIFARPNEAVQDYKFNLIYPATEVHIRKHSKQTNCLVEETPAMYNNVVKPYIDSIPESRLQWVYNIIEKKEEAERIVYEDDQFLLLPDLKWDEQTIEMLYLVVIVKRRDVASIRSLNMEHLPLLKHIRNTLQVVVPKKYPGVQANMLRMFLHYQPSYYHLHIHVTHLNVVKMKMVVGDSHLLEDAIDNIENVDPEYYQKRTLRYSLGMYHPLFEKLHQPDLTSGEHRE